MSALPYGTVHVRLAAAVEALRALDCSAGRTAAEDLEVAFRVSPDGSSRTVRVEMEEARQGARDVRAGREAAGSSADRIDACTEALRRLGALWEVCS